MHTIMDQQPHSIEVMHTIMDPQPHSIEVMHTIMDQQPHSIEVMHTILSLMIGFVMKTFSLHLMFLLVTVLIPSLLII
jgi:hypothetical protein